MGYTSGIWADNEFVGLILTMTRARGWGWGLRNMFWSTHQLRKRTYTNTWSQKLHGVVASMYSLYGKQDAVHVLPMRWIRGITFVVNIIINHSILSNKLKTCICNHITFAKCACLKDGRSNGKISQLYVSTYWLISKDPSRGQNIPACRSLKAR